MVNDNHYITKDGKITNNGKVVGLVKNIKPKHEPIVLHKGERVVTDIKKLHGMEKKYGIKLYPRRKI